MSRTDNDSSPSVELTVPLPKQGRLLAVDYGHVRIGLALCDADHIVVSPYETYSAQDVEKNGRYFVGVAEKENLVGFVVGWPISLSGHEGPKATECRQFADWLKTVTGKPVALWDERFTSAAAEDILLQAKLTKKKRKQRIDQLAAVLILRSYLDWLHREKAAEPSADRQET